MAEQTIVIRLTETQIKALEQFIGRVNLNAKEVPVWNDLMQAFTKAEQVETEVIE